MAIPIPINQVKEISETIIAFIITIVKTAFLTLLLTKLTFKICFLKNSFILSKILILHILYCEISELNTDFTKE